ncbi:hypothetical protein FHU10_3066 [Serratia fonticola]|jgi:hypothetical protein|uniref:Uncharacterized protein n=1 Tax=Serratia fonticola TaxID=47917 RepID=A0A559T7C3_SERFO|nr:hypothetical protein FHU09_4643 [Serratia fonticola]TQI95996.1 hypothetical protein FHU11_1405 [Serratia fonticola]TVZ70493.1 hypothetical protein FHU10_3066 [Serratia fonticola]
MAGIIVGSGLLLAGCESKNTVTSLVSPPAESVPQAVETPPPEAVVEPQPEVKENRMGLCQSELASLKTVNPRAYAVRKAYFDNLVKTASVYTAVRGEVNSLTKDTLDALYKYKTNQVCAEIERDVLNGLIRKGESVK